MRIFLITLILIFTLQSWTKANDIKEFEIEGISLGDSLLEHFTEEEIKNFVNKNPGFNQKDEYYELYIYLNNSVNYEYLKVTFKQNDKTYKIYGIGGVVYFPDNYNDCIKTQKKIIKDVENLFVNADKYDAGKNPSVYDQSGESYFIETNFTFKNGDMARVYCSYWTESITREKGWEHSLQFLLNDNEFLDFLRRSYN